MPTQKGILIVMLTSHVCVCMRVHLNYQGRIEKRLNISLSSIVVLSSNIIQSVTFDFSVFQQSDWQ